VRAGIDSAGGAQSWAQAPELQSLMTRAVRNATAPIFFLQAANDFDLSPSKTLSAEMNKVGNEDLSFLRRFSLGWSQLWLFWIGSLGPCCPPRFRIRVLLVLANLFHRIVNRFALAFA